MFVCLCLCLSIYLDLGSGRDECMLMSLLRGGRPVSIQAQAVVSSCSILSSIEGLCVGRREMCENIVSSS